MFSENELNTIKEMNTRFLYLLDVQYTGNSSWNTRREQFVKYLERQNNGTAVPFQYCSDKLARCICQFNADTDLILMGKRFVDDISDLMGRKMTMQEINNNYDYIKSTLTKQFALQLEKSNMSPNQYVENDIKMTIRKYQEKANTSADLGIDCLQDVGKKNSEDCELVDLLLQ